MRIVLFTEFFDSNCIDELVQGDDNHKNAAGADAITLYFFSTKTNEVV